MQHSLQAPKEQPRQYLNSSLWCSFGDKSKWVFQQKYFKMKLVQINIGSLCTSFHRADIQSQSSLMLNPQPIPRFPISKGQQNQSLGCSCTLVQVHIAICPPTAPKCTVTEDCHIREDTQISVLPCALERTQTVRANLLSNFLFCLIFVLHHASNIFLGKMCLDKDGQCF